MRKLVQYLKANDMTAKDLAFHLRVSPTTISHYINRGTIPSVLIAVRLEKLTRGGVSVYDWK